MNTTPVTNPARDLLARHVFDRAICAPSQTVSSALYILLESATGAIDNLQDHANLLVGSEFHPPAISGSLGAIYQTLKIARILAEYIENNEETRERGV